jgi:hypothetical protein
MAQTSQNVSVRYKVEGTFNTAPGASGAKVLRKAGGGAGGRLARNSIASQEVRDDGQTSMGRMGTYTGAVSYPIELAVGAFDDLLEALIRSTWTAAVTITEATASLTSITTTTNTIVAGGGSWITAGVRVGDVIRITNHSTAANNSKNLLVTGVTASTITVPANSLTLNAVADTTFTITILKKLKFGATPTRRSWYLEEYNQDITSSEVGGGMRVSSLTLNGQPNGMVSAEITFVGADWQPYSGSAPYFTSPTTNTAVALVWADARVLLDGVVKKLTEFSVAINLNAQALDEFGDPDNMASDDVYEGNTQVTGSIALKRADHSWLTKLRAETEFSIAILLVEPDSEPKDCLSLFLPRCKVTDVSKSLGGTGALIDRVPFMVGKKESTTGFDDGMFTICTSAT